MLRNMIIIAALILFSLIATSVAYGQRQEQYKPQIVCGKVEMINQVLEEPYKEAPVFSWVIDEASEVRGLVTANRETGTTTVFFVKPEVACVVSTGNGFRMYESLEPKPPTRNAVPKY